MQEDKRLRIVFLVLAAAVVAAAILFGRLNKEDESYKMAGVGPGDIVVNPYSKEHPRRGPRGGSSGTTKKPSVSGGDAGQ